MAWFVAGIIRARKQRKIAVKRTWDFEESELKINHGENTEFGGKRNSWISTESVVGGKLKDKIYNWRVLDGKSFYWLN